MTTHRQVFREVAEGGRTPDASLPVNLSFDDADSLMDVLDGLVLDAFVTGRQPYGRATALERVRPTATLLPVGAQVQRDVVLDDGRRAVLCTGPGWTALAQWRRNNEAHVAVTATSAETADAVLAEATRDATEPEPAEDSGTVTLGFWSLTARGAHRRTRLISAPLWEDISGNYTERVATTMSRLVATDLNAATGRLLLMHGPPGTGKTTALRALTRAWRKQCEVDVVLDPEKLFGDPSYLMEVTLGQQDCAGCEDCAQRPAWRMLLLEDCDELIRSEAKAATGQALSRLLNLTDGILGQGLRILIVISTNEDLTRLHPAVVRPGRCLAQIEVGKLPYAQACAWLGTGAGIGSDGASLAELYALRDGVPAEAAAAEPSTGQYL